ncbi:MAG: tRNA (cytidine(34)-2'-O)-methyltransferase [Solobacterium sp.]|jgi:tRNA (cytidine/uridine-2'-O-)-methyltransferase|nr:tRNA (cytidine(34)-2'-O)-methyltransferase [Solobacterium sp.]MCH4206650.1 tRNA (cytidine(34)-2'-O)-methyltransferase [Solobacterium sp.]MCH4228070.1 tRNA (cytidine(34)-2'-O)-methyltransferase [Solobacterium sp.]MCH4283502.1 tRNA (cytidine(34)-2'-O)-methyltransferase [Solobacterium sp.]
MINVVLYEPEIPQNTGNIMRTCMAFGCRLHLIEPLGFYMDEKHLKRAGMDYVDDLDFTIYPNWTDFKTKNVGSFYYVTRYGSKAPSEFDYKKDADAKQDIYVVFGKESTGIDKEILYQNLDRCIRIPMVENARSLNLSNCVALCIYEVIDQLGYPGLAREEVIKGPDFLAQVHERGQK